MPWQDRYTETGKFRDAEFFVESHNLGGGRRSLVHEFPLRDEPFVEDLGRQAKQFRLSLFVLGTEYMDARDALIDALDEFGPGTLIHPWLGTKRVNVIDYDVTETTQRGGIAAFSVQFIEAGATPQPQTVEDTQWTIITESGVALEQVETDFLTDFAISTLPEYAINQVSDFMFGVVPELRTAVDSVQTAFEFASSVRTEISAFENSLATIIRTPATFATRWLGLVSGFGTVGGSRVLNSVRALLNIAKLGQSSQSPALYQARVSTKANPPIAALSHLISRSATVEAAKVAASAEFESRQQAVAIRDELVEIIDDLALDAGDVQYQNLLTLQAAVSRDLTTRGAQLPELLTFPLNARLPALAASQRIFQDGSRDGEIIARNAIRHPGFIDPQPLEVLDV